jgi:hypothetical protein
LKLAISQPRFVPALNYLDRFRLADTFVYLDNVQYTPRDWENRNRILTRNGEVWLTVPVIKVSQNQLILETRIDNGQSWQRKLLNTLHHAYSKAPYYVEVIDALEQAFAQRYDRLMDLNHDLISRFLNWLSVDCSIQFASNLNLREDLKGEQLLLGICKVLGATEYISGSLGRNYLEPNNWRQASVTLSYHDYQCKNYPQSGEDFVPWLSCLDLFFNSGPKGAQGYI